MVVAYLVYMEYGEYSDHVFAPCAIYLSREFADAAVERASAELKSALAAHPWDDYDFWTDVKNEWGVDVSGWDADRTKYSVVELPLGDAANILTMGRK